MQHRPYLWLHLTFDIIEQSPSEYGRLSDIETLLSNLPFQVSKAYERILSRSKNQTQTKILLQIILAAARPLTLDEANIALTLALRKQRFAIHAALKSEMWPREPRNSFKSIVKNLSGLFINVYDSKPNPTNIQGAHTASVRRIAYKTLDTADCERPKYKRKSSTCVAGVY
jgi:ankyrin repeat domain-containing protein 50